MPTLRPFRALRYGHDLRPILDRLVSPAVVGATLGQSSPVHPYNVRHLVRGDEGPRADQSEPPFTHAARLLARWKEDGDVVRDPRPAFYVYEQRAGDLVRRGVVCLVRIERDGVPGLLPHESSRAGSVEALRQQLATVRCQLSLVMAVVPDREGALAAYLAGHPGAEYVEVTDGDGVMNRIWVDEDPVRHLALAAALRDEHAVIADGHHRVDAARQHRAALGGDEGTRERPSDYVMTLLVPAAEPGLRSRPTHRVCERLGDEARAVLDQLGGSFILTPLQRGDEASFLDGLEGLRFVLVQRGRVVGLTVREERPLVAASLHALPLALRSVEPAVLASLVLDPMRAAEGQAGPGPDGDAGGAPSGSTFSHNRTSVEEVAGSAFRGEVDAAFLLRGVPPSLVVAVAEAGLLMPPKSTNFQPKPIKGLLMNPLVSF